MDIDAALGGEPRSGTIGDADLEVDLVVASVDVGYGLTIRDAIPSGEVDGLPGAHATTLVDTFGITVSEGRSLLDRKSVV